MAFYRASIGSGGGSINPQDAYVSAYNVNVKGTAVSLTSGKTYVMTWNVDGNGARTVLTNGTILYEKIGNGGTWSSRTIYTRLVIFKATASSVTISTDTSGNAGRMYDVIITKLD